MTPTDHHVDAGAAPSGPIDKLLYYGGAASILALFGLVLYSVMMRYVFNRPPLWSQDAPLLLFTWMVFVVVGLTAKLGPEIRVAYFVDKLPRAPRLWLRLVTHLATVAMAVVLFVYSVPIIQLSGDETMLSTGWSEATFYYALPAGCLFIAFYQLRAIVRLAAGRSRAE